MAGDPEPPAPDGPSEGGGGGGGAGGGRSLATARQPAVVVHKSAGARRAEWVAGERDVRLGGGLIGLFVRHPNGANLLMALLLIAGVFGLANLNAQLLPPTVIKQIEISIAWPGASAEDVSANILEAVEPAVRFLDGVDRTRSYAREGSAFTSIDFDAATDMQKALADVEQAIAAITTLPEDAETPSIRTERLRDTVARIGVSGPFSEEALQYFAKRIRDDLLERGIDRVTFSGLRDKEIRIEVAEHELRRLDLEIDEIAQKVRQNTTDRPSGTLGGAIEKQIRVLAPGESPEAIGGIEVKAYASGERVLLEDIADIATSFDPNAVSGARRGDPAIELTLWRATNADAIAADRLMRAYLDEARGRFPSTLEIGVYGASTEQLWDRISVLVNNGWQGLLVVLVVLFVFLNARTAFWVAAGIPIAFAATLAIMYASGQTINMISLFALIMMIGVIVDDAIVVAEQADTLAARGLPPDIAAEVGAKQMLMPVMAASITTIAAFAPIFQMRDVMGQIMSALPLVAIAIIVASVIECFLILPGHLAHAGGARRRAGWSVTRHIVVGLVVVLLVALIARLPAEGVPAPIAWAAGAVETARASMPDLAFMAVVAVTAAGVAGAVEIVLLWRERSRARRHASGPSAFRRGFDRGFARFRDGPFRRFVWLTYRLRYATLAFTVGSTLVVLYGLYFAGGHVKFVFFPQPESESLRVRLEFNPGAPRDQVMAGIREIEAALRVTETELAPPGETIVRDAYAILGRAGRDRGDNLAEMRVELTPTEERSVRTNVIAREWRERLPQIPGVKRVSIAESRGGPPGRDIDVELQNAPPDVLKAAAADVIAALSDYAGVGAVTDDLPFGKPELAMRLTPRGAAMGFTLDSVGRQIRNAFEGTIARRLPVGDDEIKVRVVRAPDPGGGDRALRDLWLKTPSGEFAPLTEVVAIEERDSFSIIQRRDGRVTVSVTADVDSEVTTAVEIVESLEREVMPQIAARHGIDYEFGGRDEERRRSFADLRQGALLALAAIYITLAWVFGCYWRPIAVILIVPFGAVGAILGHYLLGFSLTIVSFAGLLGLVGILVNDSIILVRRMDERLGEGEELAAAAVGASQDRLRAVLLTSLTTIGGLFPLLFETSRQAQFLLPMAITIVFGLAAATLLVLFLVPTLIGIGADVGAFARALLGRSAGGDHDESRIVPAE